MLRKSRAGGRSALKRGSGSNLVRRSFSLNSRDHAFSILGLKSFSDSEIRKSFAKLQEPLPLQASKSESEQATAAASMPRADHAIDVEKGIIRLAETDYPIKIDKKTLNKVTALVVGGKNLEKHHRMTLAQYKSNVIALGEKLDPRVWNIGLSFLCTGKTDCCTQVFCCS